MEWKRGPVALEWSGVLDSANRSVKGTRALRPRGLPRQPAGDGSILREITVPVTFCSHPDRKKVNFMPVGAPDCQIKWVVFLTGIGAIIECKPLMPS